MLMVLLLSAIWVEYNPHHHPCYMQSWTALDVNPVKKLGCEIFYSSGSFLIFLAIFSFLRKKS